MKTNDEIAAVAATLKDFAAAVEDTMPKDFVGGVFILFRDNGDTVGALYGSDAFKQRMYPHETMVRVFAKRLVRAAFKDRAN